MCVVSAQVAFLLATFFLALINAELRQVIVVARHGVRGPYGPVGTSISEEHLKPYSNNGYKFLLKGVDWGTSDDPNAYVTPKITNHGRIVIRKMGEYFRKYEYNSLFGDRKELNSEDCEHLKSYADNNERDNVTAISFFNGFAPECGDILPTNKGAEDLFQQGQTPTETCPTCSKEEYAGFLGSNTTDNLVRIYEKQIAIVNDILGCCQPSICYTKKDPNKPCTFLNVACSWQGLFYSPFRDPLSEADFFTEWFLLQTLNNMSLPAPSMTLEDVISLAGVHLAQMDLMTNEYSVANFGSTLIAHITAAMEQTVSGKRLPLEDGEGPPILHTVNNRFLYYAGHDINLLFIRKMLRLEWLTESWLPNQPAVGGMIIFELHYMLENSLWNSKSNYFVKAFFEGASPRQIRNAETLSSVNPPERVPISIPRCSVSYNGELRCPFSTFKKLVSSVLEAQCTSENLQPFIRSLEEPIATRSFGPTLLFGFISAIICAIGIGMWLPKCLRAIHRKSLDLEDPQRTEYSMIKPE